MLPQLIVQAAMSVAFWLASRWVNKEALRVDTQMRRAQRLLSRIRSDCAPQLQLDPKTGLCHPVVS